MKSLITVLFAPTATFEREREKLGTGWVFALVVLMILTVLNAWLLWPITETMVRAAIEKQQAAGANMDTVMTITRISGFVGGLLGVAVTIFIEGVLLLLVNLIVRGDAKYMQLVKVAIYAYVPLIINSLLTGALLRASDAQSLTDVSISLGALFSDHASKLARLASIINPFSLWWVYLLIVGTAVMTRKSRKSVGMWIVLAWLVVSIASALLAKMPA